MKRRDIIMAEKSRKEKLKDVFIKYKEIWTELYYVLIIGFAVFILGIVFGSNYISFLGIALLIGSFIGIFFGIYLGMNLGWMVPFVINLFLGVYLALLFFSVSEVVFASYVFPAIGGIIGYIASKKRIFLDQGIEAEYYKNKRSYLSIDK